MESIKHFIMLKISEKWLLKNLADIFGLDVLFKNQEKILNFKVILEIFFLRDNGSSRTVF